MALAAQSSAPRQLRTATHVMPSTPHSPGAPSSSMAGTGMAGTAAMAHSCESLLPTTGRSDLQEACEDEGCAFMHSHDMWDNSSGDKAAQ